MNEVQCPKCGSSPGPMGDDCFFFCQSCHHAAYIDINGLRSLYTYSAKLQIGEAEKNVRQYLAGIGLLEGYDVVFINPLYLPFWQTDKNNFLARGSSRFHGEGLEMLFSEAIPFDLSSAGRAFERQDVDTQPVVIDDQALVFVPLFRVEISFEKRNYTYFVNGVSGRVYGEPIPFVSSRQAAPFFPVFLVILFLFLVNSLFFQSTPLAMGFNFLTLFIFYQVSKKLVEKKS